MAALTLKQILSQLSSTYDPQVSALRQRQGLIPQQTQASINEAGALKDQSFDQILGGARQRGLGFSGVPLGEQAKYASTVYAPAVLRAKSQGQSDALNLEDAILGTLERRNTLAQQLRQGSLQQDLAERQFAEDKRRFGIQLAESRRAARGGGGGGVIGSFGGGTLGGSGGGGGGAPGKSDPIMQDAYNDVATRISQFGNDAKTLRSDYLATASSAKYGNVRDLFKLQIYRALRPDLFKSAYSWEKTGGVKNSRPVTSISGDPIRRLASQRTVRLPANLAAYKTGSFLR